MSEHRTHALESSGVAHGTCSAGGAGRRKVGRRLGAHAFSAASATPSATLGVKSSAVGGPSMGYVRPLSVTRRAAPRRGRRVADRAADLTTKKRFERVLLCRQTTNRCLPLWLGYNTVPVAGSARTAPAPPLPSLLLRLFLAFFLALLDLCLALLALLVARFFVFLRRKAKSPRVSLLGFSL